MDDYTKKHFDAWLKRNFPHNAKERLMVKRAIVQIVNNDPDVLQTHSWPELERMALRGENPVRKPNRAQVVTRVAAAIKADDLTEAAKLINSLKTKKDKGRAARVAAHMARSKNPRKRKVSVKKNPIVSVRRSEKGPWQRVGEMDSLQGAKLTASAFGKAGYYAKVEKTR